MRPPPPHPLCISASADPPPKIARPVYTSMPHLSIASHFRSSLFYFFGACISSDLLNKVSRFSGVNTLAENGEVIKIRGLVKLEWFGIESAPKDGTWVLVWYGLPHEHGIAFWNEDTGAWHDWDGDLYGPPTHWMPLPEGPK